MICERREAILLLKCLTVLSPNETELLRLTEMPTGTEEEVQKAAEKLMGVK